MLQAIRAAHICLSLAWVLACAPWGSSQAVSEGNTLTLPADKTSVVRFFYQPADGRYFHFPLVFRVVEENDPRLDTAPVFETGRTAYITVSEVQRLIGEFSHLDLSWHESPEVESLETYKTVHSHGGMSVKVLSAKGTAEATIRPNNICKTLGRLDAGLQTPRALWEFQFFRFNYHCQVPNFKPKAYPDRHP